MKPENVSNINGWNVGGNYNSFQQRGHFYRGMFAGEVAGMAVKAKAVPTMDVEVEHGSALLNDGANSSVVAEIKSTISVSIPTADQSNPRIDTIVIWKDDSTPVPEELENYTQDGDGGRFKIGVIKGVPQSSPVATSIEDIITTSLNIFIALDDLRLAGFIIASI